MIKPTIGRQVWYTPSATDRGNVVIQDEQKHAATVVSVHSDTEVNLAVLDAVGQPYTVLGAPLVQDNEYPAEGIGYCEWMPYQKGQAAKIESIIVDDDSGNKYRIPADKKEDWSSWVGSQAWEDGDEPIYAERI